MIGHGQNGIQARHSVLVVDDEPNLREIVATILERDGYHVLTADNGQEAMTLLHGGVRPEAILLDLMMPVMDGWQFRVAQKADPTLAGIPVIAMSANASAKAAAIDADFFLPKPVDTHTLRATVDRLIFAREREVLQGRLVEADRLASLGTIAASVAHEINNPLAYALANLELVTGALTDEASGSGTAASRASLAPALADIRDGLLRIRSIVRDLRTFSRPADDSIGPVDVERVLDSSANIVSSEVEHRARLIKDYGGVPRVMANEARLGQICLNLIANAAQSIPEGNPEKHEIRLTTRHDPRGRVIIEVRDTGEGVPEPLLAHIFEPFFTTKRTSKGTGLGLSISKDLVEKLGGTLTVESVVGQGTVFRVTFSELTLCVADEARAPVERHHPAASAAPAPRRSRVLIVDDDARLCSILARHLRDEHDVTALTSAAVAAEQIAAGERFDVIFSDLMMPGMSGMEFHAEVLRIAPQQAKRMVFMTGGAFTTAAMEFMGKVSNRFLDKPFAGEILCTIAHELALQRD